LGTAIKQHCCLAVIAAVGKHGGVLINSPQLQFIDFFEGKERNWHFDHGCRVEIVVAIYIVFKMCERWLVLFVTVNPCIDQLKPVHFRFTKYPF
jgi:hypothetical protein